MISDEDLADVVDQLDPTQMEKLYIRLGLSKSVIRKAMHEDETYGDLDLQGQSVLRRWRQTKGKNATRKTILDAIETCGNYEVVENLEAKWTMEAVGKVALLPE